MKDSELLILKVLRTPRARQQFLLHWLKSHWPEILGTPGPAIPSLTGWKRESCTSIRTIPCGPTSST